MTCKKLDYNNNLFYSNNKNDLGIKNLADPYTPYSYIEIKFQLHNGVNNLFSNNLGYPL